MLGDFRWFQHQVAPQAEIRRDEVAKGSGTPGATPSRDAFVLRECDVVPWAVVETTSYSSARDSEQKIENRRESRLGRACSGDPARPGGRGTRQRCEKESWCVHHNCASPVQWALPCTKSVTAVDQHAARR